MKRLERRKRLPLEITTQTRTNKGTHTLYKYEQPRCAVPCLSYEGVCRANARYACVWSYVYIFYYMVEQYDMQDLKTNFRIFPHVYFRVLISTQEFLRRLFPSWYTITDDRTMPHVEPPIRLQHYMY